MRGPTWEAPKHNRGFVDKPTTLSKVYQRYKEGKSWVCKKSPTKAHKWVQVSIEDVHLFRCEHCENEREM